jgi:sensor domain CHASE-containing protein
LNKNGAKTMKLRTKTMLIICITSCILSFALSVTLNFIVSKGYSDLEKQIVTTNVERVLNQFNQEYFNLQATAYDWGSWDDTYTFINDTNNDYIQMNLQYGIFNEIKTNFMLFYNNSGELVYSKAFDFEQKNDKHFPPSLYVYIDENKKIFMNHSDLNFSVSGIILYDEKETPLVVSICPIVHTNGEGPIHGTLMVGRYLDEAKINSIENITQLTINIHPLSSQPSIGAQRASTYVQGKPVYIQPINSSYIAGYVTVDDIVGHPVFIIEAGSNRPVYNQGLGLIQNLIFSLVIIMIVFILLIVIILDRFVTSRLTSLTKSVNDIKSHRDLSRHLQAKGNDEIAILEKKIDDMLTSLHKAWTMRDLAESSLNKKIDELERFKTVTVDREIKMIELKKQLNELKVKSGEKT